MGLLSPGRAVTVALFAGLAGLSACFSPELADGAFACGPNGECPPDQMCAGDNHCYREAPDFPDAAAIDADVIDAWPIDVILPSDGPLPADGAPPVDGATPDVTVAPPDAAPPDATPPPDAAPPDAAPPSLADEGLYSDFANKVLAANVVEYDPMNHLWSDGAEKRRWIKLPAGTQVDTSDMDHWRFPVGTKVFKEFARGGALLETRVITRTGPGAADVQLRSYVWTPDESNAYYRPEGVPDVNGTTHDVPPEVECDDCHAGQPSMILGYQAVQLSKPGPGVTLQSLAASGQLSNPPPPGEDYPVPGNAIESAALGYLHANCGHCHNPTGYPMTNFGIDMNFFITVDASLGPANVTPTWLTTVNRAVHFFNEPPDWIPGTSKRIVPGDPAHSELFFRMSNRTPHAKMPPVASEIVDPDGMATVMAWIMTIAP